MRIWPGLAAFAALVIAELAMGDLPLVGALVGASLGGVLAGLLAADARDAAAQALAASAGGLGVLLLLAGLGPGVVPGVVPPAAAVTVVQAGVLGGWCPLLAWLLARFLPVSWAPSAP